MAGTRTPHDPSKTPRIPQINRSERQRQRDWLVVILAGDDDTSCDRRLRILGIALRFGFAFIGTALGQRVASGFVG
jgi:hypothetical protein